MAEEIVIMKKEYDYQILNVVYKAYAKVARKPEDYGLEKGDIFNDDLVIKAIVDNAEKLGIKGIKSEHVKDAMDSARMFAGEVSSGSEALSNVANKPEINQVYRQSEATFYERQIAEGKTILDSEQDYANLARVVDTYQEIINDAEEMKRLGLTKESSLEDWKIAIRRHGAFVMDDDSFNKTFLDAGKVAANGEAGINAVAYLGEKKADERSPFKVSYNKFVARNNAELESLQGKAKVSKQTWLDSRKVNRKAKRTLVGGTIGKALMFLAVPGAILGLFFGAAAVAGGIAALSSVASLGVVLSTGLMGFIGYHVFKRPFQILWDRLTKNNDNAIALLSADENVVGSNKNRKRAKEMYKSNNMAYEMADVKANGLSAADKQLLAGYGKQDVFDVASVQNDGLTDEHASRGHVASGSAVQEHLEEAPAEHERESGEDHTSTPEAPKKPVVSVDERRNTHEAIVNDTALAFNNLTEEESVDLSKKAIKEYVDNVVNTYQTEHPGVTISDEERAKIVDKATEVYADYVTYDDSIATSRIRRKGRKDAEIDKLNETPFVVTVKNGDNSLASATINLSGQDLANTVNLAVKDTADRNAKERALRTQMQNSYAQATAGSDVAHDVVDAELIKIAAEKGIDYASLKNYFDAKLADDKKYVHAGVYRTAKTAKGEHIELLNEELEELAGDVEKLGKLGKETNEKWAALQEERKALRTDGVEKQYQQFVSDALVEKAIDAYVEANYKGKDKAEKAKLAHDLKTYYLAEKPYIDGKVGVPSLKGIVDGKVAVDARQGINEEIQKMVKEAEARVGGMQSDKERYAELQNFQKQCDKVGLKTPNGIIAQFIERLETDVELQNKLGKENLAKLKEIVKSNPEIAKSVDTYIKAVPSTEKAGVAAAGKALDGQVQDYSAEKYVLDMCHDIYMPHKEEALKAKMAEIEAQRKADEEKEAQERARKEKEKADRKVARKPRFARIKASNKQPDEVVEETPHVVEINEDGSQPGEE